MCIRDRSNHHPPSLVLEISAPSGSTAETYKQRAAAELAAIRCLCEPAAGPIGSDISMSEVRLPGSSFGHFDSKSLFEAGNRPRIPRFPSSDKQPETCGHLHFGKGEGHEFGFEIRTFRPHVFGAVRACLPPQNPSMSPL